MINILLLNMVPVMFIRYVDVILQLIDKAGDFVSDHIWFRIVQFVTNNEDLQVMKSCHKKSVLYIRFVTFLTCFRISSMCQPYAASKVREYMDKIANETMVKVCMPLKFRISSFYCRILVTCDSYILIFLMLAELQRTVSTFSNFKMILYHLNVMRISKFRVSYISIHPSGQCLYFWGV